MPLGTVTDTSKEAHASDGPGLLSDDFAEAFDNLRELLVRHARKPAPETLRRQRANLADLDQRGVLTAG